MVELLLPFDEKESENEELSAGTKGGLKSEPLQEVAGGQVKSRATASANCLMEAADEAGDRGGSQSGFLQKWGSAARGLMRLSLRRPSSHGSLYFYLPDFL